MRKIIMNKASSNPAVRAVKIAIKFGNNPSALGYKAKQAIHTGIHGYPDFPKFLNLELTNFCNLRCVMCPRREMKRKIGFMKVKLFKKIVDQVPEGSAVAISLTAFGESFFHPKMFEMIKYAKKSNVGEVHLNSNATLLNEKNCRGMLEAGIDMLTLSFEGTDKKTYERLRPGSNFEKVRENIHRMLDIQKEMNAYKTRINIQMTNMKDTQEGVDRFAEYWKPFIEGNNGILVKQCDTWAGQVEDKRVKTEFHKRVPCKVLNENVVIYWNGDVTICPRDCFGTQILGNVNDTPVEEIWAGQRYNQLRKMNNSKRFEEIPLCANCDDWYNWSTEVIIRK